MAAKNVWLGVSVEDQQRADERIPHLLNTPAAVRFLSIEPLLGPIDFLESSTRWFEEGHSPWLNAPILTGIHQVIVGGESGGEPARQLVTHLGNKLSGEIWTPKAEALAWVRSLRDQCVGAGVAFFLKQWGGPKAKAAGRELDGRTWDEYPK